MINGHLATKNGKYYAVIELKDPDGKRKPKWIPLDLPTKGNKKRAEDALIELRRQYTDWVSTRGTSYYSNMDFAEYVALWFLNLKGTVKKNTYKSYGYSINSRIIPYFQNFPVRLCEVTALTIETYLASRREIVGGNTVNHERAMINAAMEYAFTHEFIPENPCKKVKKTSFDRYLAQPYTLEEIKYVLSLSTDSPILDLIILITAYYGLRRSEVIGLKWSALNLSDGIITIRHTVTSMGGERFYSDTDKSASGNRSMILFPEMITKLRELQQTQLHNQEICGNSYIKQYKEYVFVNEIGDLVKPEWVSRQFSELLKRNNLRHIRFHDLRHSCASILLNHGVSLPEIQEWLGHSSIAVTRDIYGHLDSSYSARVAGSMSNALGLSEIENKDENDDKKSDRKNR